jgi:DNA-binding NtrC family response regulator
MRSWLHSGSVFALTLARAQADDLSPVIETALPAHSDLSDIRVLCVDNEVNILRGMEELLERWGCEIRSATNLVETIKILDQDWRPTLVLSDYRLDHDRTGLEVLQQCRLRLGSRFVGVIISADRTDEMLEAIYSNGFAFLAKPVKPLKLRALLNRVATPR